MTNKTRFFFLILLSAFLLPCLTLGTDTPDSPPAKQVEVQQKFKKALNLAEAKDWSSAIRLFKELHAKWPDNNQITNNLAVAYFYKGRLDKAQKLLAEILESHQETRVSFKNMQMLYGYVTAEVYRQGLGQKEKIEKPRLLLKHSLDGQQPDPQIKKARPFKKIKVATTTTTAQKHTAKSKKESGDGKEIFVIEKRLKDWVTAWSAGDAPAFISFYVPDYSPQNISRNAWVKDRIRKVRPSKKIHVDIHTKEIRKDNTTKEIVAIFSQHYRSSTYQDKVTKKLTWVKSGNDWLIKEENILN